MAKTNENSTPVQEKKDDFDAHSILKYPLSTEKSIRQIEFDNKSIENMLLEIELNKSFHEKNLEMYSLIGDLIRKGCIIKELKNMEIDLYSRLNKKEIAFCWKVGDEKILFWHNLNQNCEKRQPIKIVERDYMEELKKLR